MTLRIRVAHNTLIHISSNVPVNMDQSDSVSFFACSFVPYFLLLSSACCEDSPDISFLCLSHSFPGIASFDISFSEKKCQEQTVLPLTSLALIHY